MLELYSDYLLSSFSYTTATGVRLRRLDAEGPFGLEPSRAKPQANALQASFGELRRLQFEAAA